MGHSVDFCSPWDSPFLLDYNRYYLQGLARQARLTTSGAPWYLRPIRDVTARTRARVVLQRIGERLGAVHPPDPHHYVGQYVLDTPTRRIRFAIDPHDNRRIASRSVLDWSDVYFKSNRWNAEQYPGKVLPLVNGNGLHTSTSLAWLRSLRDAPKAYDVVFISRLGAGVEHNLQLFEALSRLRCRTLLIAVLYTQFGQRSYADRLERAGVRCVTRNIAPRELWRTLASARVSVLRLGAKWCVPWRMIDLLCLGSCIAIDRAPLAAWPVPLRPEANFVPLRAEGATLDADLDSDYVARVIDDLLAAPDRIARISANNADYFDRFADPARVADDLIARTLAVDTLNHGNTTWSDAVAPWTDGVAATIGS